MTAGILFVSGIILAFVLQAQIWSMQFDDIDVPQWYFRLGIGMIGAMVVLSMYYASTAMEATEALYAAVYLQVALITINWLFYKRQAAETKQKHCPQ